MPCSSPNGLPDTNRARRLDCLSMNNKPATARDVVGEYLSEQCTVIIDSENQLRAGENVIHTTRVAVRRLRSTIRVFRALATLRRPGIWRRS